MAALSRQVADHLRLSTDTKHGVTTEAEWVAALRSNGKLKHLESFDDFLAVKGAGWINTTADFNFPGIGTGEIPRDNSVSGVQTYVTDKLNQILNAKYFHARKKKNPNQFIQQREELTLKIQPDPDAFRRVSFGHRKPDVVAYRGSNRGAFAIALIGDCKGVVSLDKDFQPAEIGHILDMSKDLLSKFQVFRHVMFSFLTDGQRFQFFKVQRESDGFHFTQSIVFTDTLGWQVDDYVWFAQQYPFRNA
jgi:hypothetical protein